MNNRLLSYLKNHAASERITELKLDAKMINAIDENGQSALQLAAYFGRPNIVLLLLSEGAEIEPINDKTRYQHPLVDHILSACREKKSDPAVIAGIYCYALNRGANELSERMTKYLPPAANVEAKFTPRQSKLYQFAEEKEEKMMTKGCDNKIENYAAIFAHAYAVKHYAALGIIISGCRTKLVELLEYFLTSKQNDCARFLIVATAMDLYEIALYLHNKNNQKTLEKFIHLVWKREGLLQGLIEQSIVENKLPAADILALINTLQQTKSDDMNLLFEHAISNRYPLSFTVNTANRLPEPENELVYRLGSRLHLTILRSGEDELGVFTKYLPPGVLDIFFGYCDSASQTLLKKSTFFKTRMDLLNTPIETKKEGQIQHYTKQLQLLNEFIIATEQELASKTCFSHPSQILLSNKTELILALVCFAGLVVSMGFIGDAAVREHSLAKALEGKTCITNYAGKRDCTDVGGDPNSDCEEKCPGINEYNEAKLILIMVGTLGAGMTGGLFLFGAAYFIYLFCTQRRQRFNDLPLTSFNIRTREAAENMLAEFKGTLFNPFETTRMESKVIDVLRIARHEQQTREAKLASLTEVKIQHPIDINDDFETMARVDDRTLSLNTVNMSLLGRKT